jgi:hypothetical protein
VEEEVTAKPKEVAASHVLVAYKGATRADPSITRSKEEAKVRANSLCKQIVEEGKNFATIAHENSDGPRKAHGGAGAARATGAARSAVFLALPHFLQFGRLW